MIPYHFCPLCGTKLTRRVIDNRERTVCPQCPFIQWGNSKTTAAILLVNTRGEILFGKRGITPYRGYWSYPGGFLESGEHPEDGVRRELREETGIEVEKVQFLGVFTDRYSDSETPGEDLLNFYYTAQLPGEAELTASDDMESLSWLDPQTLDLETLAFPANRTVLREWMARNMPAS